MQINELLVRFSDQMGMSERIKNTIFPTTYSYLTKVFIWLFVVTFTLVISQYAGVYAIFLGWLVGFVFVSTQINGMSLVNPFENNSAGVPLNQITRTIEINLLEMLGEEEIPEPVKPINDEYVL
jgi:putative membrane protein